MKLLSFGEILWDVFPDKKHIGGAPLNFAAHFAKFRENAFMLSALGDDDLGREALSRLSELSVDTRYVPLLKDKETGKCTVTLSPEGLPSYEIAASSAYDFISCENISDDFDALYFGTLALRYPQNREELSRLLASHAFSEIFVDVNIRKPHICEESLLFGMERGSIVKISDEELPFVSSALFGEVLSNGLFAEKAAARFKNIKLLLLTLGDKGASAYDFTRGESLFCPPVKVKVKATVGAGDSFSAAFLYGHLAKDPLSVCLERASLIAAFVVTETEAVPDYDPFALK